MNVIRREGQIINPEKPTPESSDQSKDFQVGRSAELGSREGVQMPAGENEKVLLPDNESDDNQSKVSSAEDGGTHETVPANEIDHIEAVAGNSDAKIAEDPYTALENVLDLSARDQDDNEILS